jgi:hypothetical protein
LTDGKELGEILLGVEFNKVFNGFKDEGFVIGVNFLENFTLLFCGVDQDKRQCISI